MATVKTVVFSAMMAAGVLAGSIGMAQADSVRLRFEDDGVGMGIEVAGPGDGYGYGDDGARWPRRGGPDREWRGDRDGGPEWRRDRDFRRKCSPDRAQDKAEDMGLRRARVVDVDWNRIVVSGRKWGERQMVVFGRAPNCPVLRMR